MQKKHKKFRVNLSQITLKSDIISKRVLALKYTNVQLGIYNVMIQNFSTIDEVEFGRQLSKDFWLHKNP